MTVTTLAGQAAVATAAWFHTWRGAPDPDAVDLLCAAIRAHALSPPVVYLAEWADRWLMGDTLVGPGAAEGRRFQAVGLSPAAAAAWAERCGGQFAEQGWLAARLREAAAECGTGAAPRVVVVIREPVGASTTDGEVRAALDRVPAWLPTPESPAEPRAAPGAGRGYTPASGGAPRGRRE
ncbi:hypothetical protein J0H58_01135 [bacterium]|nr:hypothetical protein [bacterium]